jgi:hypothetical protein
MAFFSFSASVAAGATYRPLDGWAFQTVPAGGSIQVCANCTATGVVCTLVAGSDQLAQRAPLTAGGTAAVLPTPFNAPVIVDNVAALDPINLEYTNTTGGAITVNGWVDYTPGV